MSAPMPFIPLVQSLSVLAAPDVSVVGLADLSVFYRCRVGRCILRAFDPGRPGGRVVSFSFTVANCATALLIV